MPKSKLSRFEDVVLRVVPKASSSIQTSRSHYEIVIYSDLEMPFNLPSPSGIDTPKEIANFPVRGSAEISLRYHKFEDYVESYIQGFKDSYLMSERLFEVIEEPLLWLFSKAENEIPGLRIWLDIRSPELEALPWELLPNMLRPFNPDLPLCIVRGAPRLDSPATFAVQDRLKVGVLGSFETSRHWDVGLLDRGNVEVKLFEGDLRKAIPEAINAECNCLHIVCSGALSIGLEALLFTRSNARKLGSSEVMAAELSSQLYGSEVGLISLQFERPSYDHSDKFDIVSSYRAFKSLASSAYPLPNIVAPVGPMEHDYLFWPKFYDTLAVSLSIEEALMECQKIRFIVGAWLRQRSGRQFRRVVDDAKYTPSRERAELMSSVGILNSLKGMTISDPDMKDMISKFVSEEELRTKTLEDKLAQWEQDQ